MSLYVSSSIGYCNSMRSPISYALVPVTLKRDCSDNHPKQLTHCRSTLASVTTLSHCLSLLGTHAFPHAGGMSASFLHIGPRHFDSVALFGQVGFKSLVMRVCARVRSPFVLCSNHFWPLVCSTSMFARSVTCWPLPSFKKHTHGHSTVFGAIIIVWAFCIISVTLTVVLDASLSYKHTRHCCFIASIAVFGFDQLNTFATCIATLLSTSDTLKPSNNPERYIHYESFTYLRFAMC